MQLKRIVDLIDFPVTKSTLYKWHHYGKYPELLVKFGGSLCVDLDQIGGMIKKRDIPLRKVKKADD